LDLLGYLMGIGRRHGADERGPLHPDRQRLLERTVEGRITGLVAEIGDQHRERIRLHSRSPQTGQPPGTAEEHHHQGRRGHHQAPGEQAGDRERDAILVETVEIGLEIVGGLIARLRIGVKTPRDDAVDILRNFRIDRTDRLFYPAPPDE